jgi:YHS domain-containing protein
MQKNLKVITIFFIVAVFASATGCAGKTQITENAISGTSEQVKPTTMTAVDSNPSVVVDSSLVVCPVCKMKIHKSLDKSEYKGKTYYFCSPDCKKEFDENPEKYINS